MVSIFSPHHPHSCNFVWEAYMVPETTKSRLVSIYTSRFLSRSPIMWDKSPSLELSEPNTPRPLIYLPTLSLFIHRWARLKFCVCWLQVVFTIQIKKKKLWGKINSGREGPGLFSFKGIAAFPFITWKVQRHRGIFHKSSNSLQF